MVVVDNDDAVVDRIGRVWTVCRDGGMAVRPVEGSSTNIESAGIAWLEGVYGPLRVVYRQGEDAIDWSDL